MKHYAVILGAVFAVSCTRTLPLDDADSGLSDVSIAMPDGAGTIYDSYEFQISPLSSSPDVAKCSNTYKKVDSISSNSASVGHEVKVGCDYLVVITLGKGHADDKLTTPLYSNVRGDKKGDTVTKEKLVAGGITDVPVTVYKITGAADGLPDQLKGQTKLEIKVQIGDDPASTETTNTSTESSEETASQNTPNTPSAEESSEKVSHTPTNDTEQPPTATGNDATATGDVAAFSETATAVTFTIKNATVGLDWNSANHYVVAKTNKKLVIINEDSVAHRIFAPISKVCPPLIDGLNGQKIEPGATVECQPAVAYPRSYPVMRDLENHDPATPMAKFHLEITGP